MTKSIAAYPETLQRSVTDIYHGVAVADAYRWLEDFEAPEVRAWNDEQNGYSRARLDRIAVRGPIGARLRELFTAVSAHHSGLRQRGATLFAIKEQPPKEQPLLVTLAS